ncbi:MAG: penicillin-binding protein 2 [Candidatus Eremiobacteraeota bacterium]|nr:penicillin-binding protein 2 [Candidatus Eremiobacteraeota bacterium]
MIPTFRRRKTPWERSRWRIGVFIALTTLALFALLFRLVQVQIVHGQEYRLQAQANQIRLIPVAAPRGIIYGREGKVLVRSRPSFVVALIPSEVTDERAELATLAHLTGEPIASLQERMLHHHGVNYKNFDELAIYEPYGPVILATDLSVAKVARISELLNDLPGVDLEAQPIRNYPQGTVGSHLYGYVGAITEDEYKRLRAKGYTPNDVVGKDGVEYEYDQYLRGQPGGQRIVVDAQGQVVGGTTLPAKQPVPGDSLVTSIDGRLQTIADRALAHGIKSWGHGKRLTGAVVALDPYSGGVMALAGYPNFDPNDFAADKYKKISHYLTDPALPLFDAAIAAATPTGSTFKMVTGSGAISDGAVKPNEVVYDSGGWNCGGYYARDIASGGLGNTTFVPALAASSDGYFYQMAWRLGNKRLRKWALAFGLDEKSGVDLPGENAGNWPTNAWSMKVFGVPLEPSQVCSLGIGQGAMQATPLQIANIAATVINGGTLYRPHVVWAIRDPAGHVIKTFHKQVLNHVPATQQALQAVREGMAKVTDPGGTAYGLAIDNFHYSGKTGTVETAGGSGPNTTWFVCWAPTHHPKFAMAVFVDRSGGYGASVAAPIAREILVKYFNKKP